MRKFLSALCAIFMLCIGFYPNLTKIIDIDRSAHIVLCVDFNGNLWEFEEDDDWQIGDYCNLLMHDCGTEEITDDIIVRTYYERVDF